MQCAVLAQLFCKQAHQFSRGLPGSGHHQVEVAHSVKCTLNTIMLADSNISMRPLLGGEGGPSAAAINPSPGCVRTA